MKLAIIGPSFFEYLERLTDQFQSRGIESKFFDERPSNQLLAKLLFRFAPRKITQYSVRKFHNQICEEILRGGFTHVLFVSIEIFPTEKIKYLKSKGLNLFRYGWDSIKNKPHLHSVDPHMERIASFDPKDCETEGYVYIPLYSENAKEAGDNKKTIDFMYCTTFHSRRPVWVRQLLIACDSNGWSTNFMLFYHSLPLWYLRYAYKPWLWPLSRLIRTTPFPKATVDMAVERARVVIDIHHGRQSGLTMRTFEALSLGAVVLTTNPNAFSQLSAGVLERLVYLDENEISASMSEALSRSPGPVSVDDQYYLSIDRFIDDLLILMGAGVS